MAMTTSVTLHYEGPPSCAECQRNGIPLCAHIGFNAEAWHIAGQSVHVPGLDNAYTHTVQRAEISPDRKTVTLTVGTERSPFDNLARHLSFRTLSAAKAAVRAVHHETGETLEQGHYERFLRAGEEVCIDRDLYRVASVEHPNRDPETGTAADVDLQVARLVPIPTETVQPVQRQGGDHGAA